MSLRQNNVESVSVSEPVAETSHAEPVAAAVDVEADDIMAAPQPIQTATSYALPVARRSLASRITTDVSSAVSAAYILAPFITLVDVSIIRNANGTMPLKQGMTTGAKLLMTQPHRQLNFIKRPELAIVLALYSSTYSGANVTSTMCSQWGINPAVPLFAATCVCNLPICIQKDRFLAKYFRAPGGAAARPVGLNSVAMFLIRDCMTLAASFSAVAPLASWLNTKYHATYAKITDNTQRAATQTAQLVLPLAVQIASTPIHLLGLDVYNRTTASTSERVSFIRREYMKSLAARQMRIGFAFGIGGIANSYFREKFHFFD